MMNKCVMNKDEAIKIINCNINIMKRSCPDCKFWHESNSTYKTVIAGLELALKIICK